MAQRRVSHHDVSDMVAGSGLVQATRGAAAVRLPARDGGDQGRRPQRLARTHKAVKPGADQAGGGATATATKASRGVAHGYEGPSNKGLKGPPATLGAGLGGRKQNPGGALQNTVFYWCCYIM